MSDDVVRVELTDIARTELAQRAELVLPRLFVDAGPVAVARFLEFFAARDREPAHARGVRAGRGVVPGLVRCARPGAHGGLAAARGGLHPDPPRVGAHRQAAPGRLPHARRLARRQPGPAGEPGGGRPGADARRHEGRNAGALASRGARRLLEAIDPGTLTGRRDRALVSVRLYSFARVSAVIGMRRQDYFRQERRGWLRLHEKGGTRHDVPAHHQAAEALDDYLERAGLDAATAALFQSVDPAGRRLTGRTFSRRLVLAMIKRRAAADLPPSTCCHTFRATGHGVSVEWGDARTRAADRRARLPEDDEALRPDGGHDHRRRDRAHRDLGGGRPARRRSPRDVRAARRDGRAARCRVRHGGCRLARIPGSSMLRSWRGCPTDC